jgi:glutamine synthetase
MKSFRRWNTIKHSWIKDKEINMDRGEAFEVMKEKGIGYIALLFTDGLGKLYALWVSKSEVEAELERGIGASGFPIFTEHEDSDILLRPDMGTFRVMPWLYNGRNVGAVICDVYHGGRSEEFGEAPRTILKNAVGKLKRELGAGVELMVAPEHEFYIIKRSEDGELRLHDQGAYFAPPPFDKSPELRDELCNALDGMGIKVLKQHHEALRGKHEIDIAYDRALQMGDKLQFTKWVIKKLTSDHGLIASFMPKPFNVPGGAGWHTHASLWDEQKQQNLFYSREGEYGLSKIGAGFIAGVIKHARALAALSSPAVNSYKRLVPGHGAPIYICWAKGSRSTLIRLPLSSAQGTRFEFRASDGLCNHYLFFSGLIYAGLDGIAKGMTIPPPEEDIYALKEEERAKKGIRRLPRNLGEALEELKADEVVRSAIGSFLPKFLKFKGEEWNEYSYSVHEWERQRYLEEQFTRFGEYLESGIRVAL